jgi:tetratricopeptide (TPR) repeat protein
MNSKQPIFVGPLLASGAVAVLLGLAAGPALAQQKNSKALAKPLQSAEESFKARKYQETVTKLRAAEEISGKTGYDQHLINEMLGYSCLRINDLACATKAYDALTTDGFSTAAQVHADTLALVNISYQTKAYDKAIDYGQRAIKDGYADEATRVLIGQSYYQKGDYKSAAKFGETHIEQVIKAGQVPKADLIEMTLTSCTKLDDKACETRQTERLVTYYPKPEYWQGLLITLERQATGDTNKMQVYRLMNDVDVLKNGDDYTEMGSIAMDQGAPAEAQHVLERGMQKGVFAADPRQQARAQRALDSAKKQAATDQAGLAAAEKSADAAANGQAAAAVGQAYFGYQQYDKAIQELSKALSKGGLKNEADTRLLLGIAQLKGGHKDDAVKTFKQVKGDATLERVASLWGLHARQA